MIRRSALRRLARTAKAFGCEAGALLIDRRHEARSMLPSDSIAEVTMGDSEDQAPFPHAHAALTALGFQSDARSRSPFLWQSVPDADATFITTRNVAPVLLQESGKVASDPDVIAATITSQLSERPKEISESARTFVREIKYQVEELRKPASGDDRLPQQNELIDFLERLSVGLTNLADAIDQALNVSKVGSPEPLFRGKAGQIAEQLNLGLMEYLEKNRADLVGFSLKVGLMGAAYVFLKACGLEGEFFAFLRDLLLKRC